MTSPRFPASRRLAPAIAFWSGFGFGLIFAVFVLAVA